MKAVQILVLMLILGVLFISTFSCSQTQANNTALIEIKTLIEVNTDNPKIVKTSTDDSIKQIDFKNFSYPWCSKIARLKKVITLHDGKTEIFRKDGKVISVLKDEDFNEKRDNIDDVEYTFDDVYYGDFNSDNVIDAFVSISTYTSFGESYRGDISCSYVYTIKDKKPRLIWQFDYWGWKYTGARKIEFKKAQNEIIFEMYYAYRPKDIHVSLRDMDTKSESYDRLIYKWKINTFRLSSKQNIPNPTLEKEYLGVIGADKK